YKTAALPLSYVGLKRLRRYSKRPPEASNGTWTQWPKSMVFAPAARPVDGGEGRMGQGFEGIVRCREIFSGKGVFVRRRGSRAGRARPHGDPLGNPLAVAAPGDSETGGGEWPRG